jgi:hypothetical protein
VRDPGSQPTLIQSFGELFGAAGAAFTAGFACWFLVFLVLVTSGGGGEGANKAQLFMMVFAALFVAGAIGAAALSVCLAILPANFVFPVGHGEPNGRFFAAAVIGGLLWTCVVMKALGRPSKEALVVAAFVSVVSAVQALAFWICSREDPLAPNAQARAKFFRRIGLFITGRSGPE